MLGQTDDGADLSILVRDTFGGTFTIDHHPDVFHLNNANMYTPPNGESPTMQMYLFSGNGPMPDANGGDDASIVFHEYTHGLSSRLITDSDGFAALNAPQAGAMGEAWSDWYAMDYLTAQGSQHDTRRRRRGAAGELHQRRQNGRRCASRRSTARSTRRRADPDACGSGGFTYADYGKVLGTYGPEVHADGEIWAQTLWDLRSARQSRAAYARQLITDAMRIAPPEPSFLEMRDAILLADENAAGGDARR